MDDIYNSELGINMYRGFQLWLWKKLLVYCVKTNKVKDNKIILERWDIQCFPRINTRYIKRIIRKKDRVYKSMNLHLYVERIERKCGREPFPIVLHVTERIKDITNDMYIDDRFDASN